MRTLREWNAMTPDEQEAEWDAMTDQERAEERYSPRGEAAKLRAWRKSPEGQARIKGDWLQDAGKMEIPRIFINPCFPSESEAQKLVRAYMEADYGRGSCLVLAGSVGCGKTAAAVGALWADFQKRYEPLGRNDSRRFWHTRELEKTLLSPVKFGEDSKKALNQVTTRNLIVLDDLGTEVGREGFEADLDFIIGRREANRCPTIITTNLSWENLKSRYSARIIDRLRGWGRIHEIRGRSLRQYEGSA